MSRLLNSLRRPASLLPIAALVASCGGGSGGSDTPAPPSTVQVTITAPAAGSVLTAQTPVAVQAQVSVSGSAAADGTAVSFSMPGGSFSPVAPQTRSGLASTSLTGTTAGAQTLTARSTVNGATGTGTQTIYLRPQPAALEILVPAYFHPTTNTGWSQMAASASANPAAGKIMATTLDYPMVMDTVGCAPDWLKANPKAAQALTNAYFDALEMIKAEPAKANEIMGAAVKQSGEAFAKSSAFLRWQDKAANQKFFAGELQAFMKDAAAILLEAGVIRKAPEDFNAMFDTSFIK